MAQNFLTCDRDQPLLLPPDLHDWLDEDHLAWFVIEAIEELDLDAFYASYRADGHGAAAHDPKMMLTLLTYAYCVGEPRSRQIEHRCREDVAFRVICANQVPDHTTISRFRQRHEQALADIFGQVLGLCAEAGLLDAADDELYGSKRGDEPPEHVSTHNGRQKWLKQANKRLQAKRAAAKEKVPRDREERLELCHPRLVEEWRSEHQGNPAYEAWRARGIAADGSRRMAPGTTKPYEPPPKPDGKINTTDPDARRMKFGRNFIPAYNAQTVTTEDQIVVAADVTTEGADFEQLEPMVAQAERELENAGVTARPDVVLADAGYWSNSHIDALRERGLTPIVAPDTTRNRPRKTRLGGPYDFMRRVMATEKGDGLYKRRQCMVEPVFAQIKTNRRMGRFKRRGLAAVRSEWRLIAATHNLLKLHRHTLRLATA